MARHTMTRDANDRIRDAVGRIDERLGRLYHRLWDTPPDEWSEKRPRSTGIRWARGGFLLRADNFLLTGR